MDELVIPDGLRVKKPEFDDVLGFHEFLLEKGLVKERDFGLTNEIMVRAWTVYQINNRRKPRSDAGKKRGPKKKEAAEGEKK